MRLTTKLPPRTRFEGFDYKRGLKLEMTGREWHQYAKVEEFKLARDRDNTEATARGIEVWGVRK